MTRAKGRGAKIADRRSDLGGGPGRSYPVELKIRVVREVLERGASRRSVARVFGICINTIQFWLAAYKRDGMDGLLPKQRGPAKVASSSSHEVKKEAVTAVREAHPEYGTRRIRDVLARFEALGVSETQVRSILHEAGLMPESRAASEPREHPPRRFERAAPNELWQSDIFTFLLRKHERLYLTAFLDDHSRYILSFALAHNQKSSLVMEALNRAIADYGPPKEVLTDQGRQYTVWRGETEFEEELRQHGVRHIKSRPQHPQTMGKIERFWKTLWDEFLSKTVFADYADCHRRIGLFVAAYNFKRPHQALGGLVPADRFFRMAPQVRAVIEQSIADNAMRLAHEQPTRKPFYIVGRLGDRDLSIAASDAGLQVRVGEDEQTISLRKESTDEKASTARWAGESGGKQEASGTAGAGVVDEARGPRRDGAATLSSDLECAVGGETGERRDRGSADIEAALLRVGESCALGDAVCADAIERGAGRSDSAGEDRRAREAGAEVGAGEASGGAIAAPHTPDDQGGSSENRGGTQAASECTLDASWEEVFGTLAEDERTERDGVGGKFDPDEGWRGRALSWDRKLAGESAASVGRGDGRKEEEDLCPAAGGTRGAATSVRDYARCAVGGDVGCGRSAPARHVTQPFSVDAQSRFAGTLGGHIPEASWETRDAGGRSEARERERATAPREREAEGSSREHAPDDRAGGGRLQQADGERHEQPARDDSQEQDEEEDR
jgi:transposase InsO family protein